MNNNGISFFRFKILLRPIEKILLKVETDKGKNNIKDMKQKNLKATEFLLSIFNH